MGNMPSSSKRIKPVNNHSGVGQEILHPSIVEHAVSMQIVEDHIGNADAKMPAIFSIT